MKSDKKLMAEVANLVIHSLNGTIDQEQLKQLETILENNPLAVKYYTEIVTIHTGLESIDGMAGLLSSGNAADNDDLWNNLLQQEKTQSSIELVQECATEVIEPKPTLRKNRSNRFGKLSLIAALISIAGLISFAIIGQKSLKPLVPHAEIVSCYEVEWHKPLFDYKAGDKIADNTINITKGLLKLEMNDGTDVVLQGPCSFSLESDSQVRLTEGKLTAKVPAKAIGFTVRTPSASVVDYGTEFGVSVDKYANTEAHVSKGLVELRLGSNKYHFNESLRLKINQAGQTSGNQLKKIPASITQFTYEMPSAFEELVKRLPNSNLYIRPLNDNPESLTELVHKTSINNIIKNPNIKMTDGPAFGKKLSSSAIKFSGPEEMLKINNLRSIPQHANGSYSIGFWLKLDKAGRQIISTATVDTSNENYRLFLITRKGMLQHCAFNNINKGRARVAQSETILQPGKWYFAMVVRNLQDDTKKLYLNGKLEANDTGYENSQSKIAPFDSLSFGGDFETFKGFEGALSEIIMFARALDDKEIEKLYNSAIE